MKNFSISVAVFCLSFALQAADKPKDDKVPNLTKEQRETMAKVHEQMASCLRSDKAIDVCHEEMKQACHENEACQMMMKGHKGKHKGH